MVNNLIDGWRVQFVYKGTSEEATIMAALKFM